MDFLRKHSLEDFTESDFVEFLKEISRQDESDTDERADQLLEHFIVITGHPVGSDLIYWPEPGADNSAEGITRTVKEWRAANGLPGFKK